MRPSRLLQPCLLVLSLWAFLAPRSAHAQAEDDGNKKPSMHQLYSASALPKAEANFSMFKYKPAGDQITKQPDADRMLFRKSDGTPDGYAERRGNAIFYYDRYGKISQVQLLDS